MLSSRSFAQLLKRLPTKAELKRCNESNSELKFGFKLQFAKFALLFVKLKTQTKPKFECKSI